MGGENTRKKSLLILSTIVALSALLVISAATIYTLNFTGMTANVPASGTVTVTIGTTTYNDGQTITNFAWGDVHSGDNTQQITITNNRNEAVTPSITATGLPDGWTLTISSTPIAPGVTVPVNMVLNVPSGAVAGSYSWSAVLNAASA